VSGRRPPLTTHRRLERGAVLRSGRSAPYRAIEISAGEPHLVRDDFVADEPMRADARGPGRPLLCLVHITDLQLADVQSPARFEFLNARFADPRYAEIVPVQRPQEALTVHAVDATMRTLDAVRGPATGLGQALLDTLLSHARGEGVPAVYLGTQERLRAARRFYERNGFQAVGPEALPGAFPQMGVDTCFYALELG